jgi:hypothetical protein
MLRAFAFAFATAAAMLLLVRTAPAAESPPAQLRVDLPQAALEHWLGMAPQPHKTIGSAPATE